MNVLEVSRVVERRSRYVMHVAVVAKFLDLKKNIAL